MPAQEEDAQWREQFGWSAEPVDVCWLDCEEPGYSKTWHRSMIVLCMEHARVLEAGKLTYPGHGGRWSATYRGALLPPASMATAWPWQRPSERLPLAS
jgi:hypothetical protein